MAAITTTVGAITQDPARLYTTGEITRRRPGRTGDTVAVIVETVALPTAASKGEWEKGVDKQLADAGWARYSSWSDDGSQLTAMVRVLLRPRDPELGRWIHGTARRARFNLDDLSPQEWERLEGEAARIVSQYPDPDLDVERDSALLATLKWILGEFTLGQASQELARARMAVEKAMAASKQAAHMAVLDGMPKARAAREAGISRMTLLETLGER